MPARTRKRRARPPGYYMVAGLDLMQELRRLCALPALGGGQGELVAQPPSLTVRRAAARPRRNLGFAVPVERRISVTAYPGIRVGDLQETLLHELVHIAVGRSGGAWHGSAFRRTLAPAMQEAYGIAAATGPASVHGAYAEALEQRRLLLSRRRGGLNPQQLAFEDAA